MNASTLGKHVDKAFIVFSFTFLAAPFTYGPATYISKQPEIFALFFSFAFIVTGYMLQMLYAKVMELKRTEFTPGFVEPYFKFKNAKFSMILSVLPSIIIYKISQNYLISLSPEYKISAIPLFISFFSLGLCITGIVLWFLQPEIIMRVGNIIKFVCVFITASSIPVAFTGTTHTLMYICAFIFAVTMIIRYIVIRIIQEW
ncbi:MAG: hypothetical protein ACYCWE_16835 [Eubacteriales bacterium]